MSIGKINDGGPIHPIPEVRDADGSGIMEGWNGMSLRDWFAGHALAGMIAPLLSADPAAIARAANNDGFVGRFPEYVAMRAYEQADAMLKAREEKRS